MGDFGLLECASDHALVFGSGGVSPLSNHANSQNTASATKRRYNNCLILYDYEVKF